MDDNEDPHQAVRRERAFALILGAILRQDLTGDVELAWRVAEMVAADREARHVDDD